MKKLGENADFIMGQAPPSKYCNFIGMGTPFVKAGQFGESVPVIGEWTTKPLKMARKDDVLICVVGATSGKLNRGIDCAIGRSVAAIRPHNEIRRDYIYYGLHTWVFRLRNSSQGSAIGVITKDMLADVEMPFPSTDEQDKIISILQITERVIRARKEELNNLEKLIKSRFVELFGDMTLNPNGWEVVALGKVCDVRDGTHDSPKYFNEGYPLVTSKNVAGGKIDFSECNLICKEDYQKINERSKVDFGDILMPMIGTVGKPVIVDVDAEFAIKNVALIKFYIESNVTNVFIKALLESDYFDRAVISKIRGGTQKFIALGDLRKLNVCLPPIEMQNEFSAFVKHIDKLKIKVQQSLDKTQLLFDSLMQKYFG